MKFGVCVPNYGDTISVDGLRKVSLAAEDMGYDSVWTTDHLLMSEGSGTPYEKIYDSIASLAYLAPLTRRVRLGISSLITPMRNPVVIAKQLATIDQFSGGRLVFATSSGWNEAEFSNLGCDFHRRGKMLDESIRLMRMLWEGGGGRNEGAQDFVGQILPHRISKGVFAPRPVSKKATIWVGGNSKAAMKRAVTLGDAWHPNAAPLDRFSKMVSEFESIPGARAKDICIRISLNPKAKETEYTSPNGERRLTLSGNRTENEKIMAAFEELGVSYAVISPDSNGKVTPADQIKALKTFARDFMGDKKKTRRRS